MLHVTNINSILEIQHSCRSCLTKKHCVACALDQEELREFEGMTRHRRTLRKGQRLFRQGDKFESISIVQSGSVKAYLIADDGEQQISGFHFPGELMGIDAQGRRGCGGAAAVHQRRRTRDTNQTAPRALSDQRAEF